MVKKLLIVCACTLLAAISALHSVPAQAQSGGYYFVSACGVPNPLVCPSGPNPVWFGPYTTWEQCNASWALWSGGYYGTYPRVLSSCYEW